MKRAKLFWTVVSGVLAVNSNPAAAAPVQAPAQEVAAGDQGEVYAKTGKSGTPADVYLRGMAYARQGNWEKALELFREAAVGGYAKARTGEAESLYKLGRTAEAETLFAALMAQSPSDADLYKTRGVLYLESGQYAQASADLSAALLVQQKAGLATTEVSGLLAEALLGADAYDEVLKVLTPHIKGGKAAMTMQVQYVTALCRSGDAAAAIDEARQLWPDLAQVPVAGVIALADSHIRIGQAAEALELYHSALEREPGNMTGRAGRAYALIYSGRYAEGIKAYADVLRAAPQLAPVAAEDAAALLSQGNLLGGKTLFETVIALQPDKPEYRQAYTRALALYVPGHAVYKPEVLPNSAVEEGQPAVSPAAQATVARQVGQQYAASEDRPKLHDQAVTLARAGNFSEALAIFRLLYQHDPADLKVTCDYITVLHWAGSVEAATEVYEKLPAGADVPGYVLRSVGGAYYQTGNYQKARLIFARLAAGGDSQARLWEAEALMRMGDALAAQAIYEAMLKEDPYNIDVYLSRANMFFVTGDYANAVINYEKALKITSFRPQSVQKELEVQGRYAAALINSGQPDKAVQILKPYAANGTATLSMQGDYVIALRSSGQYRLAVIEAKRMWPDYGKAPVFGLRALIECHLQLKEYKQAINIYQHILSRDPQDNGAQFGLAFALMLDGKVVQSLAAYDNLLTLNSANAPLVLRDAETLMAGQYYTQGKSLFDLVIRRFPDQPVYRHRYAEALAVNDFPRAAYKQFDALAAWPEYEKAALQGMGRMAFTLEDYSDLRRITDKMEAKYGRSAAVAALQSYNQERRRGALDTSYVFNTSYKKLQSSDWQMSAEQSFGENYWLLAGVGRTRLDDFSTGEHSTINSKRIGLRHNSPNVDWRVVYGFGAAGTDFNDYAASLDWHFSDQATLGFSVNRSPISDVQALGQSGGPVMAKNYALRYSYRVSPEQNYSIGLSRGLFNDGNQTTGFSLDHSLVVYDRNDLSLTRYLYWSRNYWAQESPLYESPRYREAVGLGLAWRKTLPKSYWQFTPFLVWGKDDPDSLNFEPYLRLEYGYTFSAKHALTAGLEYGLRSDNAAGANLSYSYRQFDLLYRISW